MDWNFYIERLERSKKTETHNSGIAVRRKLTLRGCELACWCQICEYMGCPVRCPNNRNSVKKRTDFQKLGTFSQNRRYRMWESSKNLRSPK